jgi:hypothetical protein
VLVVVLVLVLVLVFIESLHQVPLLFLYRDTLIVSLINCGTSVFSGFVIFSMMGFMAHELGLEVKDVVKSGELSFNYSYPF